MGLFSWRCKICKKEILAPFPAGNKWSQAVVVFENGDVHIGEYDGYGRINGGDLVDAGIFTMYHRHCWEKAGKPMEFAGESDYAEHQGYFFEEHELRRDYPIEGGWKFDD